MAMIKRLAHVCIQVRDIGRTIEFYTKTLDIPVKFLFKKGDKIFGAYFDMGGGSFVEAFENEHPCGITHFCLETDNIDDFIAAMERKQVHCTPKKLGCDHAWQTWLRDPDGNAFEIHQYTPEALQYRGGEVQVDW